MWDRRDRQELGLSYGNVAGIKLNQGKDRISDFGR